MPATLPPENPTSPSRICSNGDEGRSGNGVGPTGNRAGDQAGSSGDGFDGYRSAAHVDGAGIDGGVGRGGATVSGVVDRRPRRGIGQSHRLRPRVRPQGWAEGRPRDDLQNGVGPTGNRAGDQAGSSGDGFDGYRSAAHVDGAGIDGGVGRRGATVGG